MTEKAGTNKAGMAVLRSLDLINNADRSTVRMAVGLAIIVIGYFFFQFSYQAVVLIALGIIADLLYSIGAAVRAIFWLMIDEDKY